MKVLIADDSSTIRIRLRTFLKELGHQVVGEAENGAQAFDLYIEKKPDLITLDWVMPEQDGFVTLEAIRKQNSKVLIVMISSAATLANQKAAREAGANAFLKKPFDREALKKTIESLSDGPKGEEAA